MKRSRTQEPASTSVDLLALADCVEQFNTKTVVLLGDFVADEFQYGEISRVSREAPVLILKHRETQIVPGGGANAANNLASLGARVLPVTAVGDDAAGDALIAYFRRLRGNVSGIFRVRGWTTPTKSRFLAGWAHTVGQQVLRVDYEPKSPLPDAVRKKLQQRLSASLRCPSHSTRATICTAMRRRALLPLRQMRPSLKRSITPPSVKIAANSLARAERPFPK